jgi:ADP-heptose:LPS heptosyltransferase
LPGVFRGRSGAFCRQTPKLLHADPRRVAEYRQRLSADKLKVAIAWRSTRSDRVGPKKTVALGRLAPLLAVPGAQFVDVQYGDTTAERLDIARRGLDLLHFEHLDAREDLDALLALLEACDLVITTSNATAHLAGAVGRPTWVIYPNGRPPFYYWVPDESGRCLWYPSVEIVTARGWDDLVEGLATNLNTRVLEHPT